MTAPDSTPTGVGHFFPGRGSSQVGASAAAGLLRHLHPAAFPPPAGVTISQEKTGEST